MKKLLTVLGLVLGLTAMSLLAGCTDEGPDSTNKITDNKIQTVKVGVITALSGDAAALGQQIKNVLDYELVKVNTDAAAKGYKFELIYEDGKCAGGDSVTAFQKLTDIDGIQFLLGGTCSSETLGIAPLLAEKKVLALTGWSSSPEVEGKSPYLFSISYSDDAVGKAVADEIGKYKKVAILTEQNDYNTALRKTVVAALKEKYPDVQIVSDEQFTKGVTDFRNQLQKVKASDPDILFLNPNVGVTAESLIKQMAELKDWKLPKVGTYSIMGETTLKLAPEFLEGTIILDAPKVNDAEFTDLMAKIIAEKGSMSDLGNYYVATSIDALDLMSQAIMKYNGDVDMVKNGFSTLTFDGYIGKIYFGGKTFTQSGKVARFVVKGEKIEEIK
jgi:branched-chain amino acid transport system substrate-binding protein